MAGCAAAAELPGRVESEEKLTNECLLGTIFSSGWGSVRCTSRDKARLTEEYLPLRIYLILFVIVRHCRGL